MARKTSSLVVAVATLLLAVMALPGPAAAANRTITLYGDAALGWGLTNTSFERPGPSFTVELNDNVTVVLNSSDGQNHRWFLDYNGNGADDADEPKSGNFRNTQVSFNFTADRVGTFQYLCRFHDTTMTGNITIAGSSGASPLGESWVYVVAGGLLALIVVIALGTVVLKKRRGETPPPPPPT